MPEMQHNAPSLEQLLFEDNDLSNSAADIKNGYPKLKHISLHKNRLTYVPDFGQLVDQLKYLMLSYNSIESLHNIYNIRFIRLRTLNLEKNRIKYISLSLLYMPMIYRLDISGNLLETLEPIGSILPTGDLEKRGHMTAFLHSNPWHCNGSLSWLYKGLNPHSNLWCMSYRNRSCSLYIGVIHYLFCKTPKQLNGKGIMTLGKYNVCICTDQYHRF